MARGILDSLMSATYFNASALRLLRQLVFNIHNFHHHHNNFSYDQYHYHKTQYYDNNRVIHQLSTSSRPGIGSTYHGFPIPILRWLGEPTLSLRCLSQKAPDFVGVTPLRTALQTGGKYKDKDKDSLANKQVGKEKDKYIFAGTEWEWRKSFWKILLGLGLL